MLKKNWQFFNLLQINMATAIRRTLMSTLRRQKPLVPLTERLALTQTREQFAGRRDWRCVVANGRAAGDGANRVPVYLGVLVAQPGGMLASGGLRPALAEADRLAILDAVGLEFRGRPA